MDVREADSVDVRAIAEMGQRFSPGFPSAEALLRLRARLDILMPVARVETEIVGFALAALLPTEKGRMGSVQHLSALVDDGRVAWAIKAALLSRLEQQFLALESDEIQVGTDHPPAIIDQLQKIGYRRDDSVAGGPWFAGPGPRLVKRLSAGVSVRPRGVVDGRRT